MKLWTARAEAWWSRHLASESQKNGNILWKLNGLLLDLIKEQPNCGLYIVKSSILYQMVGEIQSFETISALDNRLFEDFEMLAQQLFKTVLQRILNLLKSQWVCQKTIWDGAATRERGGCGKWKRKYWRGTKAEVNKLYVLNATVILNNSKPQKLLIWVWQEFQQTWFSLDRWNLKKNYHTNSLDNLC